MNQRVMEINKEIAIQNGASLFRVLSAVVTGGLLLYGIEWTYKRGEQALEDYKRGIIVERLENDFLPTELEIDLRSGARLPVEKMDKEQLIKALYAASVRNDQCNTSLDSIRDILQ